jgi:ketosteroid isomerase-like protein
MGLRLCEIEPVGSVVLKPSRNSMRVTILLLLFQALACAPGESGQDANETRRQVASLNADVDAAVVKRDLARLKQLYADDFVFTHGTGLVEGVDGWLKTVSDTSLHYLERAQDSTAVEVHAGVAVVSGRMLIKRAQKGDTARYGIWYVRVYQKKEPGWQMISHRTTREWHW